MACIEAVEIDYFLTDIQLEMEMSFFVKYLPSTAKYLIYSTRHPTLIIPVPGCIMYESAEPDRQRDRQTGGRNNSRTWTEWTSCCWGGVRVKQAWSSLHPKGWWHSLLDWQWWPRVEVEWIRIRLGRTMTSLTISCHVIICLIVLLSCAIWRRKRGRVFGRGGDGVDVGGGGGREGIEGSLILLLSYFLFRQRSGYHMQCIY